MTNERIDRLSWHIQQAEHTALRSTCIRRQVGAIAVKDDRVIASGYNGAPPGVPHCTKETCLRTVHNIPSGQKAEICLAVHAEQNLLVQAVRHGVNLQNSVVCCTTRPCFICTKLLLSCKVDEVIYLEDYPDPMTDLLTITRTYQHKGRTLHSLTFK